MRSFRLTVKVAARRLRFRHLCSSDLLRRSYQPLRLCITCARTARLRNTTGCNVIQVKFWTITFAESLEEIACIFRHGCSPRVLSVLLFGTTHRPCAKRPLKNLVQLRHHEAPLLRFRTTAVLEAGVVRTPLKPKPLCCGALRSFGIPTLVWKATLPA